MHPNFVPCIYKNEREYTEEEKIAESKRYFPKYEQKYDNYKGYTNLNLIRHQQNYSVVPFIYDKQFTHPDNVGKIFWVNVDDIRLT